MPLRCSITWGSPGLMWWATPAARPSPPSWPSTTPIESPHSRCSSCPCCRCPAVRHFSPRRPRCSRPTPAATTRPPLDHVPRVPSAVSTGRRAGTCSTSAFPERSPRPSRTPTRSSASSCPALTQWTFDAEQAAAIRQPVLSVLGSNTAPLWIDVAEFLRNSVPDIEERTIDGVGHLLHIERPEPVAEAIADFLRRHPVT